MYVEDGLPRARACVDDGAVARFGVPLFGCYARGHAQEVSEHRLFALARFVERSDVRARDDERVRRGLRVDVAEGQRLLVLVDLRRGNLARGDLAEDTVVSCRHIQSTKMYSGQSSSSTGPRAESSTDSHADSARVGPDASHLFALAVALACELFDAPPTRLRISPSRPSSSGVCAASVRACTGTATNVYHTSTAARTSDSKCLVNSSFVITRAPRPPPMLISLVM